MFGGGTRHVGVYRRGGATAVTSGWSFVGVVRRGIGREGGGTAAVTLVLSSGLGRGQRPSRRGLSRGLVGMTTVVMSGSITGVGRGVVGGGVGDDSRHVGAYRVDFRHCGFYCEIMWVSSLWTLLWGWSGAAPVGTYRMDGVTERCETGRRHRQRRWLVSLRSVPPLGRSGRRQDVRDRRSDTIHERGRKEGHRFVPRRQ